MKDTHIGVLAAIAMIVLGAAAMFSNWPVWPRAIPIVVIGTVLIIWMADQSTAGSDVD